MYHSKQQEFVFFVQDVPAATRAEDIKETREQFMKNTRQIHQQELEVLDHNPQASIKNYASFTGMKIGLFDGKNKDALLKRLAMEAKADLNAKNAEPDNSDSENETAFCPLS